jgi:hypothetical protein
MKIRLPVHACLRKGYIVLKGTNRRDLDLVILLFKKKAEWEERNNKEFFVQAQLELRYQKRTRKQNDSVWALVGAIFESMELRKPTEEEKYNLYLDLLEVYADKVPNKFNNSLRPVHISESNSFEGAKFIDGLLYHLATECKLELGVQATVQEVMQEWLEWRGGLDADPLDYQDGVLLPLEEWRKRHPYSEASGRCGDIVRAHIVTRGSDHPDIEKSWNWIALLWDEHEQQHNIGWDKVLGIYPHLRGRVDRARRLAGKAGLDSKAGQKSGMYNPRNLAMEALEE